jgi:hypothetical protein
MDNVMVFFDLDDSGGRWPPPDKNSCPRVMQADIDAADFQALND